MNKLQQRYKELLDCAVEQGFLSTQYYYGICDDLIDLLEGSCNEVNA